MSDEWQGKTDDTLSRIERQVDDSEKQEGFALNFREKVLTSLVKIEGKLEQNEKDHTEIKAGVKKIDPMEISLTNHLKHHDRNQRLILYPVIVMVIVGFGGFLWQVLVHISH